MMTESLGAEALWAWREVVGVRMNEMHLDPSSSFVSNRYDVWVSEEKTVVDGLFWKIPPPLSADAHLTEISGFISTHIDSNQLTRQAKKADLSV